ncbi:hypothetical protein GY45DRAFT_1015639 [Cubamyces sp. BRFM 1775]|nr:hypothetical protein GY45DRAFT_1015639 [Cubamyces sp. BRFM 1775]
MAQQCALTNADILDEILEWFDYEPTHGHPVVDTVSYTGYDTSEDDEAERRRNLANAARVCKAFHEPALRVLWRQLESLFPFFSLIGPSFAVAQENVEQPYGRPSRDLYHLPDDLSGQEWARLHKYAPYVRILYLWHPPALIPHDLTPESWTSMKVLFGGGEPIFPNLRNLQWGAQWPETELPAILHFVSPTVDQLLLGCSTGGRPSTVPWPAWRALLPGIVEKICNRATRLSHFTVYLGQVDGSELLTTLSLCRPPTLRGLNLHGQYGTPPLTLSSFMSLARIDDLENLILYPSVKFASAPSLPPTLDLPRLRHLRIPMYRESCLPFRIIASARLQSLHIHHMEYSSFTYLQQTCATWARSFPNLEVLNVYLTPSYPQDGIPTRSLLTTASALLGLRNMRTFILHTMGSPLIIEDADLTALSEAWPSLIELYVSSMSTPDNFPGSIAGMLGLLSLATNCPHLTALSINRIVLRPGGAAVLPEEPLNHPLKKLEVVRGIAPDAYHLLRGKLFPHLNLQLYESELEDGSYYA